MAELVKIEDTELAIREYNGQRVVTFKDIDTVHQRPTGTAKNAFKRNKNHLKIGIHYFVLKPEDKSKEISKVHQTYLRNITIPNRGITLLTERGYLMLVKTFTDDLSWKVQDQLVDTYFKARESINPEVLQAEPMELPIHRTSSTPVPRNPSFYARNRRRLNKLCNLSGATLSYVYHHLLMRVGEEYDMTAAKNIYRNEVGHEPVYQMDLIDYFPQLSDLAESFLGDLITLETNRNK